MADNHLYLIHFSEKLSHAQHYIGSTTDVQRRLKQHANGQGARITQVLQETEKDWTLAAVFATIRPGDDIRQIEIQAKRRKQSRTFCPICNKNNIAPKGTIQIPITPIHASELRKTDNE